VLSWLGRLVSNHPRWTIAAVLLVTAGLAPFIYGLRTEADVTKMLPDDDPGLRVAAIVDSEFGGSDQVVILVESPDVFAPAVMRASDTLIQQLQQLPGVSDVQSLTTLEDVRGVGDDVVISRLIDSVPTDSARLAALRQRVLKDERYRGVLVSADGNSMLILVRLSPTSSKEAAVRDIEKLVDASSLKRHISLTGSPTLAKYMREWMTSDMVKLLPLVVLVLALVLLAAFRSWYGVLLPIAAVLIALVWTLGLIGLFRQPITIVTIILPPVLVSVGSAYGIHIIERWEQERTLGRNARAASGAAVASVGLPVFLAMATTVVGFGSNVVMKIVSVRAFSVFSAAGVLFSFVLALTFVPAVLTMVRQRVGRGEKEGSLRRGRFYAGWGTLVFRHRWLVVGIAAILSVGAGVLARRVHPETDFVRYFKSGSGPARAAELVNARFGGSMQFEFVVDGDIQDPAVLQRMERFESGLKQVPHVTHTFSLVDVLRSTDKAFNGGRAEYDRLPETREAIAQYLLLLSFSGSAFLADFVTSDYRLARISARFDRQESGQIAAAMKDIRRLMQECFEEGPKSEAGGQKSEVRSEDAEGGADGEDTKEEGTSQKSEVRSEDGEGGLAAAEDTGKTRVMVGGMPMAILALHENIQSSQLWSVVAALVAVFALVTVLFRSPGLGLAAMIPIGFTLAVSFGVMGLFGIQVDVVTAMLGSIAVGIGIDYSCHFIARFREEGRAGSVGEERLRRTMSGVGPAIVANALAVALGFVVLAFSSLVIIQKFGVLIAGTMACSSIGALAILAAVIAGGSRRNAGK
jgi:predicted RND superfamily exporter protein